ncbi:cation diffusion facilitator family transporter [Arsenicicoccus piscis]|uniref:Cation transporter n=1 Tax=Arsenicicoccus piscis TaxID=673954 RepID=A0ABQ6HNT9_9MICO|nr:cation diffusion facilitator family transporter [Arsenicicoccus piscis]MCH8628417.1 cation diffusion facilitator family transporter [Arsenicicoccus piscis]GMA20026.1 cation transporter [Arsenicicoccus piscis]
MTNQLGRTSAPSLGHAHDHGLATANRGRLLVALAITLSVLGIEVVAAVVTGSLALLVDAAHMLTDAVGLVVATLAATLIARPATTRRTWGWQRAEVIAAAAQASILLVVGAYAVYEGVQRLIHPPQMGSGLLAIVGAIGLAANVASLLVLSGGRGDNLNMRAAFLEVANDALGSVAVLVAGAVIALTGWMRADAVAGLFVAALIVPRAVILLRESAAILLESTPAGLDLDEVRSHILAQPHVRGVHDLHASTVASGLPVLTCHVVLDDECFGDGHCLEILTALHACVASHHGVEIEHATLQLESASLAAAHAEHLHT